MVDAATVTRYRGGRREWSRPVLEMTMDAHAHTHTGQSKVDRYGWIIRDNPGEFRMIAKSLLVVDHTYQRDDVNAIAVGRMCRDWSWIACGSIAVGERDGKLFVVDGQHRVLAAMKRTDITHLPCIVFPSVGTEGEAEAFVAINSQRRPMSIIAQFKAMVVAEQEPAVTMSKFCRDNNVALTQRPGPGDLRAVGWMMRSATMDMVRTQWVLLFCRDLCRYEEQPIHEHLLRAVWHTHRTFGDDARLWGRVRSIGVTEVMRAIRTATTYFGSVTDRYCAEGLLNAVNKGLRNKYEQGDNP